MCFSQTTVCDSRQSSGTASGSLNMPAAPQAPPAVQHHASAATDVHVVLVGGLTVASLLHHLYCLSVHLHCLPVAIHRLQEYTVPSL